ncbi:MAG: LytTR family DNA-binding domain-containing protein [Burkholderiaceae bacterium]
MPRALIADDEPLLRQGLREELARLWPELTVAAEVGDGLSAVRRALELAPQVCFLDIRMPGASGLEAAQALAEDWPAATPFPLLVFVTAYDQYALQAFDAQAVDYLVKPVEPARLAQCVQRLRARLAERAAPGPLSHTFDHTLAQLRALLEQPGAGAAQPRLDFIQAGVGNTVHMVPVDEVVYFEAADKYVRVVTREREHLVRLALKDLLPRLDAAEFWQIHRGIVVRARAIASARREETGKVTLTLRERPEQLVASRLYAHLFRGQ